MNECESARTTSFDGTPVVFDLYAGETDDLIVVIPGFWRERRHPSMVEFAAWLRHAAGASVAVVDVRGHGESGGIYGFNRHEHEDVAAVIRHLRDGGTGRGRLVLAGLSVGGAIAVATAARHPVSPAGLLLISSVADFPMIRPRLNPFTIHRHISPGLALRRPRIDWRFRNSPKHRATEDIERIDAPVCLIHMKNDWLISHRHSEAIQAHNRERCELHVLDLPGQYHADRLLSVAKDSVEPIMLNFLRRVLGPGAQSAHINARARAESD